METRLSIDLIVQFDWTLVVKTKSSREVKSQPTSTFLIVYTLRLPIGKHML